MSNGKFRKENKGKQKIQMKLIEKDDGKVNPFRLVSIESVVNSFLENNISSSDDNTCHLVETHLKERINNIIQQYNEIIRQMEASKGKEEALAQQTRLEVRKLAGTTLMPTPRDTAQLNPLPTDTNEDGHAAFQSSSSRGPQD
ncbi:hypothetical protein V6N13_087835 [Hibiscus sabdariffa]